MLRPIPTLKAYFVELLRHSLQGFATDSTVTGREIPLHQLGGSRPGLYQSAIAHRLCPQLNRSAITIATQIVDQIQGETTEFLLFQDQLDSRSEQPDFTLQALRSGMILFELTDMGIANWLHSMTYISPVPLKKLPVSDFPESLFAVQYSHARCCSLLRRANQEKLITISSELSYHPHPLPWLTSTQQLQLTHPTEQALIAQLMTVADCYHLMTPLPNWTQLAQDLSQAFQQFYSQCQIWGIVKQQTPQLAQARLGLVWIAQKLLQLILQEQLNLIAPAEL